MLKAKRRNNLAPIFLGYKNWVGSKRAISEIISYVMLIVIALGISAAVYQWMSTRVPSVSGTCPEDVSLQIKSYSCNDSTTICHSGKCLSITLKNNGNFNIDGAFIRASDNISNIPSTGLECNFDEACESYKDSGMLYFTMMNGGAGPIFGPGNESELIFDYDNLIPLKKIQIEPFIVDKSSLQACVDATINIEVDDSKNCD